MKEMVFAQQRNRELTFELVENYESRGTSVAAMIKEAVDRFEIAGDFDLTVSTGDRPSSTSGVYSFSTSNADYLMTFPCFSFHGWPECGMPDYSQTVESFVNSRALLAKVGWIGNPSTNPIRVKFLEEYGNTPFSEGIANHWNRKVPKSLWKNTPTYLSYQDQVDRWKYLLDMDGVGYSARAKVLLNSPRIVFFVESGYQEWWREFAVPWKHYVPVKHDLSDLETAFNRVENDESLQAFLRENQAGFARTFLSKATALSRVREIIVDAVVGDTK